MKCAFLAYNIVVTVAILMACPLIFVFLLLKGHLDSFFPERLGILPERVKFTEKKGLKIWIHAVSIGEVKLARAIAKAIRGVKGDFTLILSITTRSGRQTAEREMGDALIIYNPVDLWWCTGLSLKKISPDIFINLETEIWPNLLWACQSLAIPAFLINGRISPRSFSKYKRIRFLLKHVLSSYDFFSMVGEPDARRIITLGADPGKVIKGGNGKYDLLVMDSGPGLYKKMSRIYGIDKNQLVFVAGSTREDEEEAIIKSYLSLVKDFPELTLIIAPRHLKRAEKVESILRRYHLNYRLRSSLENDKQECCPPQVILIDIWGELFGVYSLATIIFCGGSLVPLGGQNILEAAVWGKPVIYGPSMEDFPEAKEILEKNGAGFEVKDWHELVNVARWLLDNPEEARRLGNLSRKEIQSYTGAARRQVEYIFQYLEKQVN